jgi:hypothetical protein
MNIIRDGCVEVQLNNSGNHALRRQIPLSITRKNILTSCKQRTKFMELIPTSSPHLFSNTFWCLLPLFCFVCVWVVCLFVWFGWFVFWLFVCVGVCVLCLGFFECVREGFEL